MTQQDMKHTRVQFQNPEPLAELFICLNKQGEKQNIIAKNCLELFCIPLNKQESRQLLPPALQTSTAIRFEEVLSV